MERYLFLFMMFSVIGWLWETPWVSFNQKKWTNRGFLYGPYIPIYGFAVVTIVLSMGLFRNMDQTNPFIIVIEIIYMGIVTSVWEFATSYLLEKIFHTRWWDYSHHKYNIQGRVSLLYAIFFAIGSYILWHFVLPPFDQLYTSLDGIMPYILIVFYTVFMIDEYMTLKDLFTLRSITEKLETLSSELNKEFDVTLTKAKESITRNQEKLSETIQEIKTSLQTNIEQFSESKAAKSIKELLAKNSLTRFFRKYPNSNNKAINKIKELVDKLPRMHKK